MLKQCAFFDKTINFAEIYETFVVIISITDAVSSHHVFKSCVVHVHLEIDIPLCHRYVFNCGQRLGNQKHVSFSSSVPASVGEWYSDKTTLSNHSNVTRI